MSVAEILPETILDDETAAEAGPEIFGGLSREELEGRAALTRCSINDLKVRINTEFGSESYHEAANPGYEAPFGRDESEGLRLAGDAEELENWIGFAARRQGQEQDPVTGQEPGKIFHEWPGYTELEFRKKEGLYLSTAYNACDTTADWLAAVAVLAEKEGKRDLLDKYHDSIQAAVGYIKRHVNEKGFFEEDPKFAGVEGDDGRQRRFALKVTYWKDSELNINRESREPNYPIVYGLAHFQNAEALERIGRVLGDTELQFTARRMVAAGLKPLEEGGLWDGDHFVCAIDQDGVIDPPSSDSLHALRYISPDLLPAGYAQKIEQYSEQLVTGVGYRTGIPVNESVDAYHTENVWTQEQAWIFIGALRYNLKRSQEVATRILPFFSPKDGAYPEIVNVSVPDDPQLAGNIDQFWAKCAYSFFLNLALYGPEQALALL